MEKEMEVKNLHVNEKKMRALKKNVGKLVGSAAVVVGIVSTVIGVTNSHEFDRSISDLKNVPISYSMEYDNNTYLEDNNLKGNSYINGNFYEFETSLYDAVKQYNDYIEVMDLAQELGFTNLDDGNYTQVEGVQDVLDKYMDNGKFDCEKLKVAANDNITEFEVVLPFVRQATYDASKEYSDALREYAKYAIIDYVNNKFDENFNASDISLRYSDSSSEGKRSYYIDDGRRNQFLGDNLDKEFRYLFEDVNALTVEPHTLTELHEQRAIGNRLYGLSTNIKELLNAEGRKLNVNNGKLKEANQDLIDGYYELVGNDAKGKTK